ncbi:MAG: tetratricopeptide repeat protein [Acidobacteriota bacterium]|nr:MAG: tetratricopeptide repeat protein [Acidobacteriota bacterium]
MKKLPILLALLAALSSMSWAQQGKTQTREGNKLFGEQRYDEARDKYIEGLEAAPESPLIKYNLGDAEYKLEKFQEAVNAYNEALSSEDRQIKAQSLYNLGNAYYRLGKFQESSEAYKDALRIDPSDREAKFNLEKALRQLQMNPPQQSQNQDDQEPEDKEEEDQSGNSQQQSQEQQSEQDSNQQQQDNPEEQQDQEQPEQRENDSNQNQEDLSGKNSENQQPGERDEQQQEQAEGSVEPPEAQKLPMTKEQAEQLLAALKENQKDFLKKRVVPVKPKIGDKDW